MKDYQIAFFYLKPKEVATIKTSNKLDWKQLEDVNILLDMFEVPKLIGNKCKNELKKSLKKQTNQLSMDCFQAYQDKNGSSKVFIKLKT